MTPAAHRLVLDRIESAFWDLADGPFAFDVGALGLRLPAGRVPLDEMRELLLKPPHPDVLPAVWGELVRRTRQEAGREAWTVAALGAITPALRAICHRVVVTQTDRADLQAEVVAQFLVRLDEVDPESPGLVGLLFGAARSAGQRFQRCVIDADRTLVPFDTAPDRPVAHRGGGHPDIALGRLLRQGVISAEEADLIGRTRLEDEPLAAAATRLDITYAACRKRRRRAERRIVEHYARTGLLSAERARELMTGGLECLTGAGAEARPPAMAA
ncbi:hypothetical protein AB0O91_38885 [Kitasatospora sp. NPDC089797]|uniref:hypothetical protein n=1 Tax=Kitasatospora sp. NPDC089797 TaxID=3155298 RepID=UPI003419BF59